MLEVKFDDPENLGKTRTYHNAIDGRKVISTPAVIETDISTRTVTFDSLH